MAALMDKTYLFGMSRDGTLGLLLGFGAATFAYLGIFYLDAVIKHFKGR